MAGGGAVEGELLEVSLSFCEVGLSRVVCSIFVSRDQGETGEETHSWTIHRDSRYSHSVA